MPRTIFWQRAFAKILAPIAHCDKKRAIAVKKWAAFNLGQGFDNGWGSMVEEERHKIAAAEFIEVNDLTGIFRRQEPRRRFADADHFPTPQIWRPNSSSNCGIVWNVVTKITPKRPYRRSVARHRTGASQKCRRSQRKLNQPISQDDHVDDCSARFWHCCQGTCEIRLCSEVWGLVPVSGAAIETASSCANGSRFS